MILFEAFKEKFLNKGNTRTVKAKHSVVYLFFLKGGSILANLILVPLTLHYVDSATYGVWLTLSSIVGWLSFFDIGLNNGLRNRLTEALAHNDLKLAKSLVSTTYAMLTLIFIPLMCVLLLVSQFVDWAGFLNLSGNEVSGLRTAVCIIIIYFCIQFILNTINVVLTADQKPEIAALSSLVQQVISIIVIAIMIKLTNGSLVLLCIALCIIPILVLFILNVLFLSNRYKDICPSISTVDFKKIPDLLSLGVRFFIIQVAGIIQFQLVNFIIIRNYGAEDVTEYNVAYKYFSILTMLWNILLTPIWSAVTDAMAKNDITWVKNAKKKFIKISLVFYALGIVMLLLSNPIYNIWVGDSVTVHFELSFWLLIYSAVSIFGSLYVSILNGAGQLNVQAVACVISPFVFLGLSYFLIGQQVGVHSIVIASVLSNFNAYLLAPIQCNMLLKSAQQNKQ